MGSGGDYFSLAFRQQTLGKIIGARTWGGLVKSSVHYRLADGKDPLLVRAVIELLEQLEGKQATVVKLPALKH